MLWSLTFISLYLFIFHWLLVPVALALPPSTFFSFFACRSSASKTEMHPISEVHSTRIILVKWCIELILFFSSSHFFHQADFWSHGTLHIYRRSKRTHWYILYCAFWLLGLDSCNYPLQCDQMSIWVCAHSNDNIIVPKMVNILKWQQWSTIKKKTKETDNHCRVTAREKQCKMRKIQRRSVCLKNIMRYNGRLSEHHQSI